MTTFWRWHKLNVLPISIPGEEDHASCPVRADGAENITSVAVFKNNCGRAVEPAGSFVCGLERFKFEQGCRNACLQSWGWLKILTYVLGNTPKRFPPLWRSLRAAWRNHDLVRPIPGTFVEEERFCQSDLHGRIPAGRLRFGHQAFCHREDVWVIAVFQKWSAQPD